VRLLPLLAAILLAACNSDQTMVAVPAGFYPSAIAFDAPRGRFLVGSLQSGEVIAIGRGGDRVATLRAGAAPEPVLRVAVDRTGERVWLLFGDRLELRGPGGELHREVPLAAGNRLVDLLPGERGIAYALDAATGSILRIEAASGRVSPIARVGGAAADPAQPCTASEPGTRARDVVAEGALALLPDPDALLVVRDGRLWRVTLHDARAAEIAVVTLDAGARPLAGASQLVSVGPGAEGYRIAVLRGASNDLFTLEVSRDLRGARIEEPSRTRLEAPARGAFDGRTLHVLVGPLRHHPALCGDGRPATAPRIAHRPVKVGAAGPLALGSHGPGPVAR
jgi:hypothetical protein